jgi:hypothetical protein
MVLAAAAAAAAAAESAATRDVSTVAVHGSAYRKRMGRPLPVGRPRVRRRRVMIICLELVLPLFCRRGVVNIMVDLSRVSRYYTRYACYDGHSVFMRATGPSPLGVAGKQITNVTESARYFWLFLPY